MYTIGCLGGEVSDRKKAKSIFLPLMILVNESPKDFFLTTRRPPPRLVF